MSTTGHESEAINVQGLKASLQKLKTDHIDGKSDKSTTLAGYGITDAYTKNETYTKTEVNGLVDTPHQEYVTVDAYANLPAEGSADTIYRVSNWDGSANSGAGAVDATVYSEYAWDDVSDPNKYVFLCVKSQIGEVFDISVYNNNAKYADLAAALNGGANIPQSLQKGGMSVKFVQSSDNKYVQYRLMADDWSINTNDWAIADEGVYVENPEFIYVKTDAEGKILWAIKVDGSIYYGAGCPQQVKDYIEEKIAELSLDEYEDIVAFLNDYLGSDTTLKVMIDSINERIPEIIGSPEFIEAKTDSEGKLLAGRTHDGTAFENVGFATPKIDIDGATIENIQDPEGRTEINTDCEGKILSYRDSDGVLHEMVGIVSPSMSSATELMYKEGFLPLVDGDFYSSMPKHELIELYNSKLDTFSELCKCNKASFYELSDSDNDDVIVWKINHNFREDVVFEWMSKELFMSQLNKYFQIPIYRFCDAKINNTNYADCSLRVLFNESVVSRVNVEGYTDSSFQCVKTGTEYPPITEEGGTVTINNGWKEISYNSSYPLYVEGTYYQSGYTRMYEPSSLISDDGQKIELFGQTAYTESEDGVNWSSPVELQFPQDHKAHSHSSVHKIDGVYMMVGCSSNDAASPGNPVYQDLWTSTDKVHWEWRGHLVSTDDNIGSGENFVIMGNSYMFKDNGGTYYLYYEGARVIPKWETCLMTCTDLFYDRGNGFIGNWQQCPENPIFPYLNKDPLTGVSRVWCNPEFVKGQDNQPIKLNGRYYLTYLTGFVDKNGAVQDTLNRMYSYDLVHWVEEGCLFDNRDIADGGEVKGDNGDHCMCEFKGRTYLFYSENMNTYGYADGNIRYTIDDRPQIELLKIKP